MDVLIVGCGWVGSYAATQLLEAGHRIWATCTSDAKAADLAKKGFTAQVVDFDREGATPVLLHSAFDVVIISVPITRKDGMDVVARRFAKLRGFLERLTVDQYFFFGSVGIYPDVTATIFEDTFPDSELGAKLLLGERVLRGAYPTLNILRLGGLFGLERVLAKYFVDKVCAIGYQTANFVHIEDIYGIISAMMAKRVKGRTYNVVCPEHPLKKDVIEASAAKHGYGLPYSYPADDRTAKRVSPDRVMNELGYRFRYRSPLEF